LIKGSCEKSVDNLEKRELSDDEFLSLFLGFCPFHFNRTVSFENGDEREQFQRTVSVVGKLRGAMGEKATLFL
jgi:hypothetical protein